ncbi:hypothetical protein NPIL_276261 [Nephila pilipes]|uniref:Core Histone H2A/H2B/H3 domain-containing protein n=1 Tax=Nephila pilipes TaxID=299642 RepID=A0A8X6Q4Z3_NEPPI|nr:hypothetical protein NPIL_276261 [Nephila pilipes]
MSDSKLVRFFGEVIKFVDNFNIEQDESFLVQSECFKKKWENPRLIYKPFGSSMPIQRISYSTKLAVITPNKNSIEYPYFHSRNLRYINCYEELRKRNYESSKKINITGWETEKWCESKATISDFGESYNKSDQVLNSPKKKSNPAVDLSSKLESLTPSSKDLTDTRALPFPNTPLKFSGIFKHGRKSVKRKYEYNDSDFESFVRELVIQVTEDLTLSQEAVVHVENILMQMVDAIVNKAMKLVVLGKRKTLTMTDLQMAIELTLPPKLANMAIRNASLVVFKKCNLTYY